MTYFSLCLKGYSFTVNLQCCLNSHKNSNHAKFVTVITFNYLFYIRLIWFFMHNAYISFSKDKKRLIYCIILSTAPTWFLFSIICFAQSYWIKLDNFYPLLNIPFCKSRQDNSPVSRQQFNSTTANWVSVTPWLIESTWKQFHSFHGQAQRLNNTTLRF